MFSPFQSYCLLQYLSCSQRGRIQIYIQRHIYRNLVTDTYTENRPQISGCSKCAEKFRTLCFVLEYWCISFIVFSFQQELASANEKNETLRERLKDAECRLKDSPNIEVLTYKIFINNKLASAIMLNSIIFVFISRLN